MDFKFLGEHFQTACGALVVPGVGVGNHCSRGRRDHVFSVFSFTKTVQYIFLLKSRFEENLQVNIDLPKEVLPLPIPTLTLQNLVENAIKHNVISKKQTLIITITFEQDCIIVQNPINLKSITENSTGLGLEYIYKQYHKYFNDTVVIDSDNQYFTVKLPTQSTKQLLQAS